MRNLLAATLLIPALAWAQAQPPSRSPAPVPGTPGAPPPRPAWRPPPSATPPPAAGTRPTPAPAPVPGTPANVPGTPGSQPVVPAAPAAAPGASTGAAAEGVAVQPAGEGRCQPLQGKFLLAFNKADIVDVLEQASRWTCRNFAYTEDIARGKITLLSKTPVTAEEAYAAFLASLTSNNIAIYQSGRYWKLIRIADSKKTPIPTLQDGEAVSQEQPVTKLIRLRHADPDMLRGLLGNYTSPQGADIQSVPPDLLIITDIGLNIIRLEKLIESIDRPSGGDLVRFIQVKYAPARDLAEKINQIFQTSPSAPGRSARRPVIGGVGGVPVQPGSPPGAPIPSGGGDATELSISKVMADERTNKLVVLADERSFQRIQELVAQLDLPTAGDGQIHVVFMKNANAEDLAQTLSALAQGQSSARRSGGGGGPVVPPGIVPQPPVGAGGATTAALFSGEVKVTADKIANALIILASGSDYATMQRLIEKLDRPRRQVFIEAVIMEVSLQDKNQFGASVHTALPVSTSDGKGLIPLSSQTGRLNTFKPLDALGLGGFLTGFAGPVSAELKDILPGVSSIGVLIQALQSSSDVNVLSTPHILASDNEDAEISVGQNVPFQAGIVPPGLSSALGSLASGGGTSNLLGASAFLGGGLTSAIAPIQRQNVELRVKVKPQINEGESVTMQLDEQTEEIASSDPVLGPTTAKRAVKTKITVRDQTTIVIGGLMQDRIVKGVSKTPILGDIPVLGWLFRDQTTTKTKTNLLLFLTPYIIRDSSDYRRILERKRREQKEFLELVYGTAPNYDAVIDFERKGGPYSKMRRDVENESAKFENGGGGAPGEGAVGPDVGQPPAPGLKPPAPAAPQLAPPTAPPGAPPTAPPGTPPRAPEAAPPAGGDGTPAEPPPPGNP